MKKYSVNIQKTKQTKNKTDLIVWFLEPKFPRTVTLWGILGTFSLPLLIIISILSYLEFTSSSTSHILTHNANMHPPNHQIFIFIL